MFKVKLVIIRRLIIFVVRGKVFVGIFDLFLGWVRFYFVVYVLWCGLGVVGVGF